MKKGKTWESRQFGIESFKDCLDIFLAFLKEKFGARLISLVLYGSVARGEARKDSDIDLLIILDDISSNYHRRLDQILAVQSRLERKKVYQTIKETIGIKPYLSYLILSKEEANKNLYIYLDMVEDARILYDQDNFFSKILTRMKDRLRKIGSQRIWLEDGTWYWDLKPNLKIGEIFTL